MLQLVIKNGTVLATHSPDQNLQGVYPGAEVVLCKALGVGVGDLDPRTLEEKRNYYQDLRRMAYPPIAEQLDMMYWDQVNGTTKWMEMIQEIKGQYPKLARAIW
jgi:hypothetical protein